MAKAKYKYPKNRLSITEAVLNAAKEGKYYAGFDTTGSAYFDAFTRAMARFISQNYRRRKKVSK